MEGNNNEPFAIGEKVVALKSSSNGLVIKDRIYTVAYCAQCEKCKNWFVGLLEISSDEDVSECNTCIADVNHKGLFYRCGRVKYFAPIKRDLADVAIEKEVLDSLPKITEERSDTILKPHTVN